MTVKIQTENGQIELSNEVIATVVGGAATDNYGVVGMASRNQIRDNFNEILKKEKSKRGEDFNVFKIMHVENDEVRTHSAMLAALMDPKGTHS